MAILSKYNVTMIIDKETKQRIEQVELSMILQLHTLEKWSVRGEVWFHSEAYTIYMCNL